MKYPTIQELRLAGELEVRLEKLNNIEPSPEFWDKFAEAQLKKYKKITYSRAKNAQRSNGDKPLI